jgi:anti-anti-sigma regulatory factor
VSRLAQTLETLSVFHINDIVFEVMTSFTNLKQLWLKSYRPSIANIHPDVFAGLARLQLLEYLNIEDALEDHAFRTIGKLTALTELDVEHCSLGSSNITDTGFAALTGLSNLKTLYVRGFSSIGPGGGRALAHCLPTLHTLELSQQGTPWPDADAEYFGPHEGTSFTSPEINDFVFNMFTEPATLRKRRRDGGLAAGTPAPATAPALTSLDLSGQAYLNDAGVMVLARAAPQLASLKLCDSKVTDAGLDALVASCPLLTSVDISHCKGITKRAQKKHAKILCYDFDSESESDE